MASFGITLTTAYLSRQFRDFPVQHTIEQMGRTFGHTFWITLSFSLATLVLSLFLKKSPAPQKQAS